MFRNIFDSTSSYHSPTTIFSTYHRAWKKRLSKSRPNLWWSSWPNSPAPPHHAWDHLYGFGYASRVRNGTPGGRQKQRIWDRDIVANGGQRKIEKTETEMESAGKEGRVGRGGVGLFSNGEERRTHTQRPPGRRTRCISCSGARR